jgi:hypothetical protein
VAVQPRQQAFSRKNGHERLANRGCQLSFSFLDLESPKLHSDCRSVCPAAALSAKLEHMRVVHCDRAFTTTAENRPLRHAELH